MPVLIWQMGRVGSVALMQSLQKRGVNPFHAHYIFSLVGEFTKADHRSLLKQLIKPTQLWRIISIAREPISRNLSAFLYGLNKENYYNFPYYKPERLANLFINNYNHSWCHNWFDLELGKLASVYDHDFDYNLNCQRLYSYGKFDIMVLRTENLNDYTKIFERFLNLPNLFIPTLNSSNQWYYSSFVWYLRHELPKEFVEKQYTTEYAKHFYSEEEREKLFEYWTNPTAPMVEWQTQRAETPCLVRPGSSPGGGT